MKFINLVVISLILISVQSARTDNAAYTLDSPYQKKKYVFKGQLHVHSNRSDGKHPPRQVMGFYYRAGYNFMVFTEHNKRGRRDVPSVRYQSPYRNFLVIPGFEIFSEGNKRPNFYRHHILGIGLTEIPEMRGAQYVINQINKNGGIPILCHPEWRGGFHYTIGTLEKLKGYHHVERTVKWDYLLSKGRKVFMVHTDDFHSMRHRRFNKGFVMVYSNKLGERNILENLKKGNFYTSNGALIKEIKVENDRVTITAPRKSFISFYCFAGCRVYYKKNTTSAAYKIVGNESYIRARVRYRINGKYKYAYTNPIFIKR